MPAVRWRADPALRRWATARQQVALDVSGHLHLRFEPHLLDALVIEERVLDVRARLFRDGECQFHGRRGKRSALAADADSRERLPHRHGQRQHVPGAARRTAREHRRRQQQVSGRAALHAFEHRPDRRSPSIQPGGVAASRCCPFAVLTIAKPSDALSSLAIWRASVPSVKCRSSWLRVDANQFVDRQQFVLPIDELGGHGVHVGFDGRHLAR